MINKDMLIDELKKQYEQVKLHRPGEVDLIHAYEKVIDDLTPHDHPKLYDSSKFVFGL